MEPGANTTYVAYRLQPDRMTAGRTLKLNVTLLANARDHHGQVQADGLHPQITSDGKRLRASFADQFTLHVQAQGGTIDIANDWFRNFDLPVERQRGLPDRDNHLCVGRAQLQLRAGEWVGLVAGLQPDT